MDSVGKTVVGKSVGRTRFVPSVVEPTELTVRPVSARSGQEIGNRARLVVAEDHTTVDQTLVHEAAAWITAKIAVTLRRGAEEVGEYVLDRFFGADPMLSKSKNPYKNASLRALAQKCGTPELPISRTWLTNAVGVAVMIRRLPETARAFKELPPSYQESLLPLRDPNKVEKAANEVAARELSYRELRRFVAEERARVPKADSRGRPPMPVIVKTLGRGFKVFSFEGNKRAFSKADVDELDEEQRKAALASALTLIERLKDLVGKLKRA
jgi:hypothetical protein